VLVYKQLGRVIETVMGEGQNQQLIDTTLPRFTVHKEKIVKHINGKFEVQLLDYTRNADRMLVFSKRTRHMKDAAAFQEVMDMDAEELLGNLKYVFSTIGSSLEFVTYTFLIVGVTRAFTHQLVRHRVGVAFAQQAQRVATQEHFGYMVPNSIAGDSHRSEVYQSIMKGIDTGYLELLEMDTPAQDARGVLPTNVLTNILVKINLRALMDMLHVRLCIRAQGEFQDVAREMRKLVARVHPWAAGHLGPNCLAVGVCKFPAYDSCPISQAYPQLRGLTTECKLGIRKLWETCHGYDPQPTVHDWKLDESDHRVGKHDGKESDIFP